jgi:hypothetical protein
MALSTSRSTRTTVTQFAIHEIANVHLVGIVVAVIVDVVHSCGPPRRRAVFRHVIQPIAIAACRRTPSSLSSITHRSRPGFCAVPEGLAPNDPGLHLWERNPRFQRQCRAHTFCHQPQSPVGVRAVSCIHHGPFASCPREPAPPHRPPSMQPTYHSQRMEHQHGSSHCPFRSPAQTQPSELSEQYRNRLCMSIHPTALAPCRPCRPSVHSRPSVHAVHASMRPCRPCRPKPSIAIFIPHPLNE